MTGVLGQGRIHENFPVFIKAAILRVFVQETLSSRTMQQWPGASHVLGIVGFWLNAIFLQVLELASNQKSKFVEPE